MLVFTPYLARQYTPEEFGLLALLTTASNISMAVACLRYDLAIPSADERHVRGLLVVSVISAGILASLVGLVVISPSGSALIGVAPSLIASPVLLITCIVLVGTYQTSSAWLLRRAAFRDVGLMRISQGACFSLLAAIPGVGLLWPHAVSFASGLFGLKRAFRARSREDVMWHIVARRYVHFPLYSLPGAALDVVGYSLCIWVLTSTYGASYAGEYSQVQRVIGGPMMLLSISFSQVLLKYTADHSASPASLRELLRKSFQAIGAVAIVGLLMLWLVGEPVLGWLLGAQWRVDREFITLIAVAVSARACVSPLSSVLISLRRFDLALAWQTTYFFSALLLFPFIASRVEFEEFIGFYAVHECILYGIYFLFIKFAIRN